MLHYGRQGRLLLPDNVPEVHTHTGQGALRGDVPGHGGGSGASIAGNIEAGKEPVDNTTVGDLHDHVVGVDEVSGGTAGVVGGDVLVPGQNGVEDSKVGVIGFLQIAEGIRVA